MSLRRIAITAAALAVSLTAALAATPAAALPANLDAHYARFNPPLAADRALTSQRFNRCMDDSGGVTVEMLDCIGAEYDRTDALLNTRYRQLMASLAAPQRERLRASERRWLATREGPCNAQENGGTLGTIIRNQCMLVELRRRTLWLRSIN